MVCLTTLLYCCLIPIIILLIVDALLLICANSKFRYYACYFCYITNTSAFAPLYLPLLPIMVIGDNLNIYFAALPTKLLTKILGIKWEIRGLEHLDKNRPAIVTPTHQSIFDILGLLILGDSLRSIIAVARKAVFYAWPIGPIFWLSGSVVFIDVQKKGSNATKEALSKAASRAKKKKMKIIIFPEGTRNPNGNTLLPFKKGAFRLALESQIPIIPFVFSPYYLIDHQRKTFQKGKMIISILPPIETEGSSIEDLETFRDKAQKAMEEEYQRLKSEVETEVSNGNIYFIC